MTNKRSSRMKRVIAGSLAVLAVVATVPTGTVVSDVFGDSFAITASATTDSTTQLVYSSGTITGYKGSATELSIPQKLGSYTITAIGDSYYKPFQDNTTIKSVKLTDKIKKIGSRAFYGCVALESINLPETITSIGENAFNRCTSLLSIDIPTSITTINTGTFYNCSSLKSIVIPDNVQEIKVDAFSGCTSLESVVVYNDTKLDANSFNNTANISEIVILTTENSDGTITAGIRKLCNDHPNAKVYVAEGLDTSDITNANVVTVADNSYYFEQGTEIPSDVANKAVVFNYEKDEDGNNTDKILIESIAENATVTDGATVILDGTAYTVVKDFVRAQSMSVQLTESVRPIVYVYIPEYVQEQYSNLQVEIDYKGENSFITTKSLSELTKKDGSNTVFKISVDVPAKEIGNSFNFKFIDGETTLPLYLANTKLENDICTKSVVDYCNLVDNYSQNDKMKYLAQTLRNYGSYAQTYFVGEDSNLAEVTTEVDLDLSKNDYSTKLTGVTSSTLSKYKAETDGSVSGLSLNSLSLVLKSETKLNFKFTLASGANINDYTFTVDGVSVTPVLVGGKYVVTIDGITARQLDTTHTLVVTKDSESFTVIASGLTYAYMILNAYESKTEKTAVCNLVRSLYLYNQAAHDYFENK